jgi:hypothetical protein
MHPFLVENRVVEEDVAGESAFGWCGRRRHLSDAGGPSFEHSAYLLAPLLTQTRVTRTRIAAADDYEISPIRRQDRFKRKSPPELGGGCAHDEDLRRTSRDERMICIVREDRLPALQVDNARRRYDRTIRKTGQLPLEALLQTRLACRYPRKAHEGKPHRNGPPCPMVPTVKSTGGSVVVSWPVHFSLEFYG